MNKKIILVESDHAFIGLLKRKLENIGIKNDFEIISPDFSKLSFDDNEVLVQSCIAQTKLLVEKFPGHIAGIFVDIRIMENSNDTLGIDIALRLKMEYPLIPVINMTNHYTGNDIELFGQVTLGKIDGILPKSYFTSEAFTRKKLVGIFETVGEKITAQQSLKLPAAPVVRKRASKADIAIITALNNVEFSALKEVFSFKKVPKANLTYTDTSNYFTLQYKKNDKEITIVAATDDKMGMPATTSLATRIIQQFDPKFIVILGICAGVERTTKIGDILVASYSWDYGSGKSHVIENRNKKKEEVFTPYPNPYDLNEGLRKDITSLEDSRKLLNAIKSKSHDYPENKFELNYHVGPFASGAAVIANRKLVDKIKTHEGKLIGFDMESYGIFYAAHNGNTGVKPISIKAVSDYGTEDKNNPLKSAHQTYAAFNSVLFFKTVLDKILINYL